MPKVRQAALGFDLGGSNLRAALVGPEGQVLGSVKRALPPGVGPEQAAKMVAEAARELEQGHSPGAGYVGLGLAAQLDPRPGRIAVAPNLGWRGIDFGSLLQRRLGRPVVLLNDLEAIAWAEVRCGVARGHDDVLVVFLGTGIGAGLVLGGRLHRGASLVAGEIGHVKVRPDGRRCGCGQRGCLEAYLGGANLTAWLEEMIDEGWPALQNLAGAEGKVHPGLVESLAASGDARARALWQELAEDLGLVLANAVTLLNPGALVLGGTVLENCPLLSSQAKHTLAEQALKVAYSNLEVLDDRLGQLAGCIGAALYALTHP